MASKTSKRRTKKKATKKSKTTRKTTKHKDVKTEDHLNATYYLKNVAGSVLAEVWFIMKHGTRTVWRWNAFRPDGRKFGQAARKNAAMKAAAKAFGKLPDGAEWEKVR